MKPDKVLSLIMSCFVWGWNFVEVCPDGQNYAGNLRLAFESCTVHACNQNTGSPDPIQQRCDHGVCDSKSLIAPAHLPQQCRYTLMPAFVPAVLAEIFLNQPDQTILISNKPSSSFTPASRLSPVLRI